MGECLFDGSESMVVWASVAIGVAKWMRVRLRGRLDGQR